MDQGRIGSFIMECRKSRGLTQAQLAEKLNITDRAVSKWENGKSLPDSSIMLELCALLGITADELLRGGRSPEPEAAPPPKMPEPPRRAGIRRWLSVLLTGSLFTAVLVCFICDTALSGGRSWSRIVALSAAFAWVLLLPAAALERGGPTGSLLALSVSVLPYLYGLSRLLHVPAVFTVGAVLAAVSVGFLWLIRLVCKRRRGASALGAVLVLLAGLVTSLNGALYLLGAAPPPDIWGGMSVLFLLLAAAFTWKRRDPRA